MAKRKKPLPPLEWLTPRLAVSRIVSLVFFAALLLLLIGWNVFFANLHGANIWLVLAIQVGPLLLVAPGVILGQPRAHSWACFLVNLYFIQGVLSCISVQPERVWFGAIEVVICFVLFCSALLYTRWRYQFLRKQAGEA